MFHFVKQQGHPQRLFMFSFNLPLDFKKLVHPPLNIFMDLTAKCTFMNDGTSESFGVMY